VAQQDPAKLASTGYDQSKETVRPSHATTLLGKMAVSKQPMRATRKRVFMLGKRNLKLI
jgi:hypothetical protein